jgi:predicted HicB family RNase H-like nuclease
MNAMHYKGHAARIEYSDEDGCFVGRLAGIRHIVTFHADNVADLRQAFAEAVDDYLETCAASGVAPQKPYSGKVMLRIPPELHARAAMLAQARGTSLNQWVAEVISRAE